MELRTRASPEQFAALLQFMESHGDIARPQQGGSGQMEAYQLWRELVDILNSIRGGVIKSLDKWKKVWADMKTKTKKKASKIHCAASGTGGGPSSRQTLTASEKRVLGIMGIITVVIGPAGIEERGFDAPPSERNSPPAQTMIYSVQDVCPLRILTTDGNMLEYIPSNSIPATTASTARSSLPSPSGVGMDGVEVLQREVPSGELPCHPPPPVPTPPPGTVTFPSTCTSRGAPQRQRYRASPYPATSPTASTTSTPRRRGLLQAPSPGVQTPFERATSEFVAVEHRRVQLEADREKNYHEWEMERLRLESRRTEMEPNRYRVWCRWLTRTSRKNY